LSREIGRADWLAYVLDTLGFVTFALGEYQAALGYYQEGLALFEEIGDPHGMALTLGGIGMVHWALGNAHLDAAQAAFERSLALCRRIGHRGQVSGRLGGLARVLNDWGDYEQARHCGEEGLSIARALNSPVYLAHNLYCLTETACGMNDLVSARRYLREGLQIALEAGLRSNLTIYLYYYALVLSKESQRPGLAPALQQQKEQAALAALALVQDHPATWQIFKVRAAWLQRWITGERPVDLPTAQGADDPLDERVVALLHELSRSAA
jgi:tetratricopeptide (TPR) repeat protein